jgi:hypothetical protein
MDWAGYFEWISPGHSFRHQENAATGEIASHRGRNTKGTELKDAIPTGATRTLCRQCLPVPCPAGEDGCDDGLLPVQPSKARLRSSAPRKKARAQLFFLITIHNTIAIATIMA